jgi:hypothetical protein
MPTCTAGPSWRPRAVATLSPEERARGVIKTPNYGEASAINFFGRDLPPAVSGHNQYFLWGPQGRDGDVVIDVNGDCGAKQHLFASTWDAGIFSAPSVMPYEDRLPIRVCRGIRTPSQRSGAASRTTINPPW